MSNVQYYCPKLQDVWYTPAQHKTHVRSSFVLPTSEVWTSIIDSEASCIKFLFCVSLFQRGKRRVSAWKCPQPLVFTTFVMHRLGPTLPCHVFFFTKAQQWAKASSLSRNYDPPHSDTPHSVGLLWTSDQPDTETSSWQHTTFTADKHPCPQWDSNPQSLKASGRRYTP